MSSEHKKFGNRLYFMNDKNIRDGLLAQRVKSEHLSRLLLEKGIVVSATATKDVLLEMLKTVRFDYYDYVYLSSLLENPDRRDSQSTSELPTSISKTNVNNAIKTVSRNCSGEDIDVKYTISGSKATVEVNYVDIDYSKAPMRQRTPKKGLIEIDFSSGDETAISFPATDMGKKVKGQLLTEFKKVINPAIEPIEIDFEHSTPKIRTSFFTKLIYLPDYDLYDVVNVSVRNTSGEDDNSDFTGQVRNAALTGKGLLTSDIYKSFPDEDYNIHKIVWKIRKDEPAIGSNQSDCYTVEAKFDDSEKSTGFSYQVKAVQKFNHTRKSLNSTSVKPEKSDVEELSKLLYKTAVSIYCELTSEE